MSAKKNIGIIVFDGVLTSEVIAPAEVFGIAVREDWFADWHVVMIGVEDKTSIVTHEGIMLGVDYTIADDLQLDVLIVPGAMEMDALLNNAALNAFIRRYEKSAEWICSNCSGAFLLAHSGVLDGKNATTYLGGEAALQAQFPAVKVISNTAMVVDNRRLSSNGNLISYPAAIALLAQLSSKEHAKGIFDHLLIGRVGTWADVEAVIDEAVTA